MNQDSPSSISKFKNRFDKFELRMRGHLSEHPVLYTLVGSVAIVLFWRGVWHTADILQSKGGWLGWLFYEPTSLVIVLVILLASGLFVSYFIGDTILLSGMKKEEKLATKTDKDVISEEAKLAEMQRAIGTMKKDMDVIRDLVVEEHKEHHSK